ncbi:DUF3311 domain-containing protein [Micromonospora endolithica]|nr:DUF3311 domain-containing protein [Micromonospora endolithica]TWJ23047.1 uncharacterized protein DUF3311 [Micromonospora endolithica]
MAGSEKARRIAAGVLLATPVLALLWPPLYARDGPNLLGLPYFYWYQFAWAVLSVAVMAVSHRLLRRHPHDRFDDER